MYAIPTFRAAAIAIALIAAVACGDSDSSTGPAPGPSIMITAPAGTVFEGDVVALSAVVRDAEGDEVPGAPISWSVNDATFADIAPNGTVTALRPGTVRITATSGTLSGSYDMPIAPLVVQQVTVLPGTLQLARHEIRLVGVRVQGQGGRDIMGRVVTITSDNPAVALIDPSGRVRAVNPGTTLVRATADGVSGTAQVEVTADDAVLTLSRIGGARLPLLVAADSVTWNGVREYHEVYAELGQLKLSGAAQPRYELDIRYAEYNVITAPGGQRTLELRLTSREFDRGIIQYDARGDLSMISELISPLSHTASPTSDGFLVRFRIPGDDEILDLLYRRVPE